MHDFNINIWKELYDFQKNYRTENCITGPCLLRNLNIHPSMTRFLYSNKISPSIKSSDGKLLISALYNLYTNKSIFIDNSNLEDKIFDFLKNNESELIFHHITGFIMKDNNNIIITTNNQYTTSVEVKNVLLNMNRTLFENLNIKVEWFYPC